MFTPKRVTLATLSCQKHAHNMFWRLVFFFFYHRSCGCFGSADGISSQLNKTLQPLATHPSDAGGCERRCLLPEVSSDRRSQCQELSSGWRVCPHDKKTLMSLNCSPSPAKLWRSQPRQSHFRVEFDRWRMTLQLLVKH